jgi:hypothetical protein
MSDDADKPMPLSREDLHELVWSKPMRELAKDFNISDVALAKRCRGLGIPVPGRGYWARIDAGQTPYRPKLPERESEWSDHRALTVAPTQDASPAFRSPADSPQEAERIQRADAAWLAEQIVFESRADSVIEVPESTRRWDPVIRTYRDKLEEAAREMRASRAATERYEKAPVSHHGTAFIKDTWKWQSAKDRGQRLWGSHKPIAFRVSLGTYERALGIINALALAARARGFSVCDGADVGRVVFAGHEAEIQMRITEQLEKKHRPRVGHDGRTEQESYMVPTGRLRISLQIGYPEGPAFEDRGTKRLESLLNPIFVAMYRLVIKCWVWERGRQEARRRAEEAERQHAEEKRIQAEQERRAAEERHRRQQLSEETKNWNAARGIREYVAHIRAADPNHTGTDDWTQWALAVADELDPTTMRLKLDNVNAVDPSHFITTPR